MSIFIVLIGVVIVGEALALLVGTHFLSKNRNPWRSMKNDLLIGLDLLLGAALLVLSTQNQAAAFIPAFWLILIAAIITHIYREWEYLARTVNPFCANLPLFIVNNLKLAGLVAIAIAGLIGL